MKTHLFLRRLLFLWVFAFSVSLWGQTGTYSFSQSGAATGLNEGAPGITVDPNIGFGSFKNLAGTAPGIFSGQLRLYQNGTKGGSIKVYAQNGATITKVVFYASGTTGPAQYSVDGVGTVPLTISSGTYTINAINATNEVEFWTVGTASGTRIYVDKFEVTYTLAASDVPPVVTGSSQNGEIGTAFSYQIEATEFPDSYAIATGVLPAGLSLDTATGIISGTPTMEETSTIGVTATNVAGTSALATIEFIITKTTQTADLPNLSLGIGDSPITLPATTDKGLSIAYTSDNPTVAAVSGNILTVGAIGTATITANNAGDSDYESFNQSFTVVVATTPCFIEDFSSINSGNNTSTSGSGTAWTGNSNFPTFATAYQAGEAVKLGSGSNKGSITSKVLTTIGGDVSVTLDVKGWTAVEGDIKVSLGAQSQTFTYTAKIADSFETKSLYFSNVPVGSTLVIETTEKRAFIDNVTVSCGTATVWTGTWSNGTPDASKDAIIAGDYNEAAGIDAKSITVNAETTLIVSNYVNTGNVINNGEIIVANNANFVQNGTFTDGLGSAFNVSRTTKPVKRLDYIAWSSPLDGSTQTLKEFSYGKVDGANQSTQGTTNSRFYTYNNGIYVATPATGTFTPAGQGYLIRTPNDFTSTGQEFYGLFEGTKPNTGVQNYDASGITGPYVFLGNPYPSALDYEAFFAANSGITGTFYTWNSASAMDGAGEYSGSNYITYTQLGAVPANSANGYAAVGQGFFVDRGVNTINNFVFTDAMRSTTQTGVFAKAGVSDKFWLQMTSPSGATPQMLIGFDTNASAGYDAGYDGKMLDSNADVIYSTADGQSLIINALGTFSASNTINVTANFLSTGNYTIGIAQKEGVFSNGQSIYLKDHVTGTETELTAEAYTFAATAGLQADRFTVSFAKGVLASSNTTKALSTVYANDQIVYINGSSKITSVEVYDMSGKLIKKLSALHSQSTSFPVSYHGMAIVKLVLEHGEIVTKKIILK